MKSKIWGLVPIFVLFICLVPMNVQAANKATCNYTFAKYPLAGINNESKVSCTIEKKKFFPWDSKPTSVSYKCKFTYLDVKDASLVVKNAGSAINGTNFKTDDFFLKNGTCPKYAMVSPKNPVHLYFFNSYDDTRKLADAISDKNTYVTALEDSAERDEEDQTCDRYKEYMDSAVSHMEAVKKEVTEKKCDTFTLTDEERESIASAENLKQARECKSTIKGAKMFSANAIDELEAYASKGCLSKDSQEYKDYYQKLTDLGEEMQTMQDNIDHQLSTPGGDRNDQLDEPEDIEGKDELTDACNIIDKDSGFFKILKQIIGYIQIGTIFLVLILGVLDLTGAVGSQKDDALKKAASKFGKRMIAAALIFLVPAMLNIIFNVINISSCGVADDKSLISELFK